MFNDIEWTRNIGQNSAKRCAEETAEFANKFRPGHYIFEGPDKEHNWRELQNRPQKFVVHSGRRNGHDIQREQELFSVLTC